MYAVSPAGMPGSCLRCAARVTSGASMRSPPGRQSGPFSQARSRSNPRASRDARHRATHACTWAQIGLKLASGFTRPKTGCSRSSWKVPNSRSQMHSVAA